MDALKKMEDLLDLIDEDLDGYMMDSEDADCVTEFFNLSEEVD